VGEETHFHHSHCSANVSYLVILGNHEVHRGFVGSNSRHKYQETLENRKHHKLCGKKLFYQTYFDGYAK